jgi:hypothetical protein
MEMSVAKKKKTTNTVAKKPTKKKAVKKPAPKNPAKKKAAPHTPVKKKAVKKAAPKKPAPTKKKAAPKKKVAATLASPTTATSQAPSASGDSPKVTVSPSFKGAPQKLGRDSFPKGTSSNDFRCYGPPATRDSEFDTARICDMGCFTQDGKDSNKYYHGAMVQDKSNNWYAHFEWGRTGAASPSFQFVACASEADARTTFAKQLHAKNDKRGEWVRLPA